MAGGHRRTWRPVCQAPLRTAGESGKKFRNRDGLSGAAIRSVGLVGQFDREAGSPELGVAIDLDGAADLGDHLGDDRQAQS